MAYRPLRSTRCLSCQRKKKSCDKAIPACGRCKRSGQQCEGYNSNLVWLKPKSIYRAPPGPAPTSTDIVLNESLAGTARHQYYSSAFWSRYLVSYGQQQPYAKISYSLFSSWFDIGHGLHNEEEPALRFLSRALGISVVAYLEKDAALQNLGRNIYQHAILHVSAAVRHPVRVKSDAVLAAIKLIQLYDLYFDYGNRSKSQSPIQPQDLNIHMNGQITLLLHRGPQSFITGYSHQVFCDHLFSLGMNSVLHRMKLVIGMQEWRDIPWEIIPKTPRDVLTGIQFDTGAFLRELDIFRQLPWAEQVCDRLAAKCTLIMDTLNTWYSNVHSNNHWQYQYTQTLNLPQQLFTDQDIEGLVLTHHYWVLSMCLESSLYFLTLYKKDRTVLQDAIFTAKSTQKEPPSIKEYYEQQQQQQDYDAVVISLLSRLKCYAYGIANSVHLLLKPLSGVAIRHLASFSMAFALRLLNAIEEPGEDSREKMTLLSHFEASVLGRWTGSYTGDGSSLEEPSPSDDGGIKRKQAALLWWTKGETGYFVRLRSR